MIWQWMDGLVSKAGITRDLEAYRQTGIGGVQNFQIGGPLQTLARDTTKAVGTEAWKQLMRFAIDECARLGLSFGTHNCPGWSSSACPTVRPQDSMQKLVWTETKVSGTGKTVALRLRQPDTDPAYNYYEDIAVLAMPDNSIIDPAQITDLLTHESIIQDAGSREIRLSWRIPKGRWTILRIGHTTNGRTNASQSATGGTGLECDKMSREAVNRFWSAYPSMLLQIAGEHAGKTFNRIEIDSYEAGSQDWTPLMPAEFERRRGYGLLPWLPVLCGKTVRDEISTTRFKSDWQTTITDLFAENYYGEMERLARLTPGMNLLIQPYGKPVDTEKTARAARNSLLCAEFWTRPDWGWPSVPHVVRAAHRLNERYIYGEGFTCWPLSAWQDCPETLKPVADRAFAMGINHVMLHAAASNPWPDVRPGMTFGKWGTQFTYGQTWWDMAARPFFRYISRCQALLQAGRFVANGKDTGGLQWLHRQTDSAEVYFYCNPTDTGIEADVTLQGADDTPELWFADDGLRMLVPAVATADHTSLRLKMNANTSVFIILRKDNHGVSQAASPLLAYADRPADSLVISTPWTLNFPSAEVKHPSVTLRSLVSWTDLPDPEMKYFSGTAVYRTNVTLPKKWFRRTAAVLLNLGTVKNVAVVSVNGIPCDTLWKAPFVADITRTLHPGRNEISVAVANLWPNRMIGDEQEEDDMQWGEPFQYDYAPGKPIVGQFLKAVPEWLSNGSPRPNPKRRTVVSFKFFRRNSPLLHSGLLGPVTLMKYHATGNADGRTDIANVK